MRLSLAISHICVFVVVVSTQEDPGPSPIESTGCEPHGEYWHCDGPRATAALASTSAAMEDHGPSSMESYGCEPHGDHWHCDGPLPGVTAAPTTATDDDLDHEHDEAAERGAEQDHEDAGDHASVTHIHEETAPPTFPPPTESVGCEPQGDHYHCDGPAPTGATAAVAGASTRNATNETSGDNEMATGAVPFTGGATVSQEGGNKLVRTILMASMAAVAFAVFT